MKRLFWLFSQTCAHWKLKTFKKLEKSLNTSKIFTSFKIERIKICNFIREKKLPVTAETFTRVAKYLPRVAKYLPRTAKYLPGTAKIIAIPENVSAVLGKYFFAYKYSKIFQALKFI